jgi:predicted SAM-dependent methyltransferase
MARRFIHKHIKKPVRRYIKQGIKRYIVTPRFINSYLKEKHIRKLHIGAGNNYLQGWLNSDLVSTDKRIVFLDTSSPFPFKDNTFDYIFSEHHIEHSSYSQGKYMLRECYRTLKPNGKIRVASPDLEVLLGLFNNDEDGIGQQFIKWYTEQFLPELAQHKIYKASFILNSLFYNHGHQFVYDSNTLADSMREAGLTNIVRCVYGESTDEHLKAIESHGKSISNEEIAKFEALVLEGTKI